MFYDFRTKNGVRGLIHLQFLLAVSLAKAHASELNHLGYKKNADNINKCGSVYFILLNLLEKNPASTCFNV